MKKNYIITLLLMFSIYFLNAQTIVSTESENRKAIVEELTGIHCWACPEGHAIVSVVSSWHGRCGDLVRRCRPEIAQAPPHLLHQKSSSCTGPALLSMLRVTTTVFATSFATEIALSA